MNELISRQEVSKILAEKCIQADRNGLIDVGTGLGIAKDVVDSIGITELSETETYEAGWKRLSETTPDKDGTYITCDSHGKITLKKYHTLRPNSYGNNTNETKSGFLKSTLYNKDNNHVFANNVYWWMPLPPVPNTNAVEIEALQRRIAELKAQIKALETQGESKTMEDAKR